MEVILYQCDELAEQAGFSFRPEFLQLLGSLEFDLVRRGDVAREAITLSPQIYLDRKFFDDFIDPTLGLMAKTVDHGLTEPMREMGRASRRYYNLQDLFEDISRGLINISREDAEKFGLDEDSFLKLAQSLIKKPELVEQQKKLSVADAGIRAIMGEGLTEWTRQEITTGRENLRAWQNESHINSLGAAALDFSLLHRYPLDDLFFFAYEMGANRFYRKVSAE
jgi:hypothetical protein